MSNDDERGSPSAPVSLSGKSNKRSRKADVDNDNDFDLIKAQAKETTCEEGTSDLFNEVGLRSSKSAVLNLNKGLLVYFCSWPPMMSASMMSFCQRPRELATVREESRVAA